MNSKLQAWCDSLLELSWLTALIISPIFFNVHSDRVFEPDKITLIRSVALFMIFVWIVRFIDGRNSGGREWENLDRFRWNGADSVWRKPFVLPLIAVVSLYIISTLFSVTPAVSWAGSYQRLQGTYTTLSYIAIFFVMIASLREESQVHRLVTTAIIVSIPVALYGMLQRLGLDPLPWGGDTSSRIAGHMGNAIFLAAWLIMITPLTLGRIISSFTNILTDEDLNIADIIRSSIYIFVLAIQLMSIYWTFSRGPLLGLLVGIFAFVTIFLVALRNADQDQNGLSSRDILISSIGLIIGLASLVLSGYLRPAIGDLGALAISLGAILVYAIIIFVMVATQTGWRWLWLSWLLLSLYGVIWFGIFNTYDLYPDAVRNAPVLDKVIGNYEAWRQIPGVGRYGTLLNSESRTGKVRIFIWRGAVDLIMPHEPLEFPDGSTDSWNAIRPLIGYGPEAMYVAYNRFYPPELGTVEARNASPDRSHNETWDAFVITGLLGFMAWQWLYVSIFAQTFSWLGVLRSRRDRLLLIGLWIVMGLIVGGAFSATRGIEFFGVAYPAGSIFGLIVYLVYYAVTYKPSGADEEVRDPFSRNNITMIAVIGAILAFYVEIHFGIAIVSTRTYFFAYTALLFAIGHTLKDTVAVSDAILASDVAEISATESVPAEDEPSSPKKKKGRGRAAPKKGGRSSRSRGSSGGGQPVGDWVRPTMIWTFVLAMMLGTLAFNYTVYTPDPQNPIQTLDDIPTAFEVFQQSMFVNPRENFSPSPYIFLITIMSWALGSLVALSEMAKNKLYVVTASAADRNSQRDTITGYALLLAAVVLAGLFIYGFFFNIGNLSNLGRIGYITVAPLAALICGLTGVRLVAADEQGPVLAAAVGLAGIGLALPMMLTGETVAIWIGVITLAGGILLLALFWNKATMALAWPALFVSLGSLLIGLAYQLRHASRLRQSFITPSSITAQTAETVRRVVEAEEFSSILSLFYIFVFVLILVMGLLVIRDRWTSRMELGSVTALGSMSFLLLGCFYLINVSNLSIIQSDIIYKRGKPWDNQASRSQENPELASAYWDNSIAIYERALELAPREDFYYLWLGRAYLEKSAYLDGEQQNNILNTAQNALFTAQDINPLNTDHTANLARLNSRWASLEQSGSPARDERVENATNFYQASVALSPQNSTIRNEYARMNFAFTQECEPTFDIYEASIQADPLFADTQYQYAEALTQCALREEGETRSSFYPQIFEAYETGTALERSKDVQTQRWAEAGQRLEQIGGYDEAVQAFENVLENPTEQIPAWRSRFLIANTYAQAGDTDLARNFAEQALTEAPADAAAQIEAFIANLN